MAPLIRAAFQKEAEYRDALWEGTAEDDSDYYEGIYRCAFLLYCLGTSEDIPALWQAKYLNMDAGTSMGAEFFIGAGLDESIKFIENTDHPESSEIAAYIQDFFPARCNAMAKDLGKRYALQHKRCLALPSRGPAPASRVGPLMSNVERLLTMERRKLVEIDLVKVRTAAELQALLRDSLDFPGWYGCN